MKKLLIIAAVLFALNTQAKTPDTIINNTAAVKVQPVLFSISDTVQVQYVGAYIDFDDLKTYANVRCFLYDSTGREVYNRYIKIEGEAYTGWEGSNEQLFSIVLSYLNLEREEIEE